MISRVISKTVDLNRVQKVDQLEGPLYQLENGGHTFEITCLMDGAAAAVSGTVSARFLRADEETVYFTGTLSGNVVSITLPQSCYNVNGRFSMVVFVAGDDITSAVYAVAGSVYRSTSDTIIDPTEEIPSLEELIAQIEACEEATAAAQQAASFVPTIIASPYSTILYHVGDYCTYEGALYRCIAETYGTFTPADWDQVKVGGEFNRVDGDVSDLKSALSVDFRNIVGIENLAEGIDVTEGYYINDSGELSENSGFYYTDYVPFDGNNYQICINYAVSATTRVHGYNSSKQWVGMLYKGNPGAVGEHTIEISAADVPSNVAYIVITGHKYNSIVSVINGKTIYPIVQDTVTKVSEISEKGSNTVRISSENVTAYGTKGYISYNGGFTAHNSYQVYYFTMQNAQDVWFGDVTDYCQIAVYNGTVLTSGDLVTLKTYNANNLPTYDAPLSVASGNIVAICRPVTEYFELYVGTGVYVPKVTKAKPKMFITPNKVTHESFYVNVLDEASGKYIRYYFVHRANSEEMTYGDGQTKTVTTIDIWHNELIKDENDATIFQGNSNFIHALSETGHSEFVGPGHGCVVADCTQFFADAEAFDPTTLNDIIECESFRFIVKAKCYYANSSQSTGVSKPVLDENGDPVVTSEWIYDGTWYPGNKIEMSNRLVIKKDGIVFRACYAGMVCGYYPSIDNIIINGRNGLYWNEVTENSGSYTNTDKSGAGVTFTSGGNTYLVGDTVTEFGDDYVITQEMSQDDSSFYDKSNVQIVTPPSSEQRIKVYLMPCVCTQSESISAQADVFNIGDSLNVHMKRTITSK